MAIFNVGWEQFAYFWQIMFILSILYSFREMIAERLNGVRFKRWLELDTGRYGYTILEKSLDKCKISGQVKAVHRPNIKNGWIFFKNDNCENLKLDEGTNTYYCNSEEFDTVYKNHIFEQLMLLMQKNLIYLVIILCLITVIVGAYGAYMANQNAEMFKVLFAKLAELETTYGN